MSMNKTKPVNMSWSQKLERLLRNFDVKTRIGSDGCGCKSFYICDQQVGMIRPDIWKHLCHQYSNTFLHDSTTDKVILNPAWNTYEERSAKFEQVLLELRKKCIFKTLHGWRSECYDISSKFGDPPLMKMERSATCLFGIKRYGVHINGYVKNPDGSKSLWIQRRSSTKETWPGKLDNMVSGGFTVGMTVTQCVRKEAVEEASVPPHLLDAMHPAGTVSFIFEDDRGIFPETLFVYDLELPQDFQPQNLDQEVESFHLCTIEEVKAILVTDDFKLTSSLVTLDFLVRHGFLNADDEPHYTELLETLHTPLHRLYPSS